MFLEWGEDSSHGTISIIHVCRKNDFTMGFSNASMKYVIITWKRGTCKAVGFKRTETKFGNRERVIRWRKKSRQSPKIWISVGAVASDQRWERSKRRTKKRTKPTGQNKNVLLTRHVNQCVANIIASSLWSILPPCVVSTSLIDP